MPTFQKRCIQIDIHLTTYIKVKNVGGHISKNGDISY